MTLEAHLLKSNLSSYAHSLHSIKRHFLSFTAKRACNTKVFCTLQNVPIFLYTLLTDLMIMICRYGNWVWLLILVLLHRGTISSSMDSLPNESSCPESKTLTLSVDVLDIQSVSLSDIMEPTVGPISFRWHNNLPIKIVPGLLIPVTYSIW